METITKTLTYPKQKNKICLGVTIDNEIVYAEMEIGSCDNDHYTITHTTLNGLIKDSEGEDLAREYLEDGELWKEAVYHGNVTSGLDDWIDDVLNIDGWQHVIGDLEELGNYGLPEEFYYIRWSSCGASVDDFKKKFKLHLVSQKDIEKLIKSDKLHLKDFKNYTKKEKEFFETEILPMFNLKQNIDLKNLIPLLIGD